MTRKASSTSILLLTFLLVAAPALASASIPWVNGDFTVADTAWTFASTTRVVTVDGNPQAFLQGCGDGTWQLSRGISKGIVPGAAKLEFDVPHGNVPLYSIRMIMLDAKDPMPYANNLFAFDPTGTLTPNWFDDQVLAWEDYQTTGPLQGHVVLDPIAATGYNIPGWSSMNAAQRTSTLQTMTHMTLVFYGCAAGFQSDGQTGATVDNFAWTI